MVVLVAVDGESLPDPTVPTGVDLADAFDDELVVLHVMPQDVFDERWKSSTQNTDPITSLVPDAGYGGHIQAISQPSGSSDFTIDQGESAAAGIAEEIATGSVSEPIDATYLGRVGEPAAEVVAEAGRQDARHIVIAGRKRTPAGKALFGSTTQSIILEADRPVTIVSKDD